MVEVLHVYKEVEIVNKGIVEGTLKEPTVVTISYDEKPGMSVAVKRGAIMAGRKGPPVWLRNGLRVID